MNLKSYLKITWKDSKDLLWQKKSQEEKQKSFKEQY